MSPNDLAPIALFTFKRPEHTRKTLESLATNPEFDASPLYVFCDGARNDLEKESVLASREVVRNWLHPRKQVIEASINMGLARSVIAGVTQLCKQYGRVIVMEDDLRVSPVFLDYMNRALARYHDDQMVFQVTGHMWPVDVHTSADSFFMPLTNSLGWGTWQRAWKHFDEQASAWPAIRDSRDELRRFDLGGRFPFSAMMKKQLQGKSDSWAIRWYLTAFLHNALVLYPARNLVVNIGFDGEGTHSISVDQQRYGTVYSDSRIDTFPPVGVDWGSTEKVIRFLSRDGSVKMRLVRRIRKLLGI